MPTAYTFEPIGFVRSPFLERVEAPRQAVAEGARGQEGRIELLPGRNFEHALEDLESFDRLWVVFVFHKNVEEARGWNPKVQPPRSEQKRGVFATRSPHRPNPIGLSAVRLTRVEGLTLHVADLDLLDGTPVLDLKPYIAYADAFPDASQGWVASTDPAPSWEVEFAPEAKEQLAWLAARGVVLESEITSILSVSPRPNRYRRIKKEEQGFRLALRDFRVAFEVEAQEVTVLRLFSGYRPAELLREPSLELHRGFTRAFPR
ncbi:MAG: tRNA (N6-threonylcarbamoyladenosine(37)-N6)-methyltransferase TrmO [Deltaproteobacteria bacterium]|nr:tRNA (N6-threonylcarbamoyladenosine(37)-N6)-methyltransferase TrmO [Deltaproteobacteria bacterium]